MRSTNAQLHSSPRTVNEWLSGWPAPEGRSGPAWCVGSRSGERQIIATGGRTIHVGMPAKQAARLNVHLEQDHNPTDEEIYTPKKRRSMGGFGRSGSIREAADSIFWLASPLADFVTGQTIIVGGGMGTM